jgi:hypothetical protein
VPIVDVYKKWAVAEARRKLKARAIAYKGGKCERCGYDRCPDALDFHHRDPTEKDFQVSTGAYRRWTLMVRELDKCVMLCANCHREEHYRQRSERLAVQAALARGSVVRKMGARSILSCAHCRKPVEVRPSREKRNMPIHCSLACRRSARRHAAWPRKQRLAEMIWRIPATAIATRLGVSSSAVKRMCARMGIETPPRGHWAKRDLRR